MPGFVPHYVEAWTTLYSGSAVLRTLVAFTHIVGLAIGGGAAIAADYGTLVALRKGAVVVNERREAIHGAHRLVVVGLGCVILSGLLLFAADTETYAVSKVFWIKMAMVAVLMINGAMMVRISHPVRPANEDTRRALHWTAALSLSMWFFATLAGAALPNLG